MDSLSTNPSSSLTCGVGLCVIFLFRAQSPLILVYNTSPGCAEWISCPSYVFGAIEKDRFRNFRLRVDASGVNQKPAIQVIFPCLRTPGSSNLTPESHHLGLLTRLDDYH